MRKPILHILWLLLLPLAVNASEPDIDSLKKVLQATSTDEDTLNKYIFSATNLMLIQHTEARLVICNWALKHARRQHLYNSVAHAMFGIAKAYGDNDDYVNTTKWCIASLKYYEKHNIEKLKTDVFQLLGYVYYYNNQYGKAEEFYKKSIRQALQFNDSTMLCNGYIGLAVITIKNGSVKTHGKQPVYNCLKQARIYLRKKTKDDKIYYYSTFSNLLTEIGEYDSALMYVNNVKQYIDSSELKDYYTSFYLHLGKIYAAKRNWVLAEKNYLAGIAYCKREGMSMWLAEHLRALAQVYYQTARYRAAFENYRQSTQLTDSIVNATNFAKAADFENKYEREKQTIEITHLQKEKQIQQIKLQEEEAYSKKLYIITALVSLTAVFLGVLAFLQIKNARRRKISYLLLQQKNMEIQHQSEKLSQQSKLIGKYQSQVTPDFIFNAVNRIQHSVVTGKKEESVAQLQGFSKLMRQVLTNSELDFLSLEEEMDYITNYVTFEKERLENAFSFTATVPENTDEILIPPMVIQPFVENAIKHVHAENKNTLHIELHITESNFLHISIRDNGTGFNVSALTPESGKTIYLIKSRLALLFEAEGLVYNDDYFRINSSPETGTTVHIVLPLKYKY